MAEKPKASSTPKVLNISSRRPIGDSNKRLVQSPIYFEKEAARHRHRSHNYEDEQFSSGDSNDETDAPDSNEIQELSANMTFCNCLGPYIIIIFVIIFSLLVILYSYEDKTLGQRTPSLHQLHEEFPSQVEDFWLYIQVGIDDILKFHQPKTFLFVYDEESQRTADTIIYKVSKFAVCILRNCTTVPVTLEGDLLNTSDILEDYGKIVARNKKKLEESGVMIIKNLEKVPGTSAQAFHSFCDEHNPLVKKALFIFTLRVDRLEESNTKYVENYLRHIWNDIKDDKFYPLFTRISSNILPIKVEQ